MSSHATENKTLKSDLNVKIALPRLAGMAMERHFQEQREFCVFPWGIPPWLAWGPLKELYEEKTFVNANRCSSKRLRCSFSRNLTWDVMWGCERTRAPAQARAQVQDTLQCLTFHPFLHWLCVASVALIMLWMCKIFHWMYKELPLSPGSVPVLSVAFHGSLWRRMFCFLGASG